MQAPSMQFAAPNPGGTQLISFFLNLQSTKETMYTWSNTQSQGTALSGNSLHSGRTQWHYLLLEKMNKDSKKYVYVRNFDCTDCLRN